MYIRPSRPDEIYHASHKYFMKIGEGKNARYFYTQAELQAYKKEISKRSSIEDDAREISRQQKLENYGLGKKLRTEPNRRYSKKWHENYDAILNSKEYLQNRKRAWDGARKHNDIVKNAAQSKRLKREEAAAKKYAHTEAEINGEKKRPRSRKKNVKKVISKIILGSRVGGKKLGGGRNGKS